MNRPSIHTTDVLIQVPLIQDEALLSFAESGRHIPFSIQRVYWITQADSDKARGQHAHHQTQQVLFCLGGTIDILLDNGAEQNMVHLDAQHQGVLLDPYVWHEMHNFTPQTQLLVLASEPFVEADYIRNYEQFLQHCKDRYDSHE